MNNLYQNLEEAKQLLTKKAQKKLAFNSDYEYGLDILGEFFDDAIKIIKSWTKAKNDDFVIEGKYDYEIVKFIVQSITASGLEGQSENYTNGSKKIFYANPESNLKASIPQTL